MSLTDNERAWIDDHFDNLRREVVALRIEVEKLKIKYGTTAGIWGLLGGCIPVGITICTYLLVK